MLDAQQEYFRSKNKSALINARDYGRRVRARIQKLRNPSLF